MLETYKNLIKKLYGKTPSVRIRYNVYNVRLTSRTIVEDLNKFASFGQSIWTLPSKLFSINGAKESWLQAFFSAEAYVGPNHIKIQTVNKKGMKEISRLLTGLGISNNYYEYQSKKVNHLPVGIVIISKKEARFQYHKKIGFCHSKKTKALKKSLNL